MENAHIRLDREKLARAQAVLGQFALADIRKYSLSRLAVWQKQGVWCSAYDEWRVLLTTGSDEQLRDALQGESENSNRLRQSPPYVGLIPAPGQSLPSCSIGQYVCEVPETGAPPASRKSGA